MTTVQQPGGAEGPPKTMAAMEAAWINDELIARTQDVWGRHLRRRVNRGEAIEMLLNVQSLAMAFNLANTEIEPSA
ncbi:MAG: hypothetical protein GC162_14915 [Planctomycetes bacterium]|nr:hypothetical protein [Planctomycetota bacterium]